jgi:hypothetical protein
MSIKLFEEAGYYRIDDRITIFTYILHISDLYTYYTVPLYSERYSEYEHRSSSSFTNKIIVEKLSYFNQIASFTQQYKIAAILSSRAQKIFLT